MRTKLYFQLARIFFLLSVCWTLASSCRQQQPPNIVFILADDQRNDALGCAGHPLIKTPVIDKLAEHGLRFTNAFVTTPICAASRATILTGLVERSHGYTFGKDNLSSAVMSNTYAAALKKAGYQTGFFGKFGIKMNYNPGDLFDIYTFRDRPYLTPEGHIDQLNTKEAIQFIEDRNTSRPFCLSVSFSSAHAEDGDHLPGEENHFAVIEAMKGKYRNIEIDNPRLSDTSIFNAQPDFLKKSLNRVRYYWRWDTHEKYDENLRAYYGLISGIDYMTGQIIDKLKEQGLDKNTIIIYMADNGYYMGDRGFAGKWSHYEESLRVPLIIYDPRNEKDQLNMTNDAIVLNLDIAPTILDYAGVPVSTQYQGKSLRPFYNQENVTNWRSEFFCEHLMDHDQIPKWEGIRTQRYVYARYFDENPDYEFLHDLQTDPDQLYNYNQDEEYNKILQEMRRKNELYRSQYLPKQL